MNCDDYTSFYRCDHHFKIRQNLYLSYDDKCPRTDNKKNYEIIGILFGLIDIIGVPLVWLTTVLEYNKILKLINFSFNFGLGNRMSPSSLNSTSDCSVVIRNDTQLNNNVITQANIQSIETIIYPDPCKDFETKNHKSRNKVETKRKSMSNHEADLSILNSKNELI